MRLDQYLSKHSISQADFGMRLVPAVTQGAVSQWVQGGVRISLHRALEILKVTNGEVTVEDCAGMYVAKEAA